MNRDKLSLNVIPSGLQLESIKDYNKAIHGTVFSTSSNIKVSKVSNGYSILYYSDDLVNTNPVYLSNNIIKIFMEYKPDAIVDFTINYLYEVDDGQYVCDNIDMKVMNVLITLETQFLNSEHFIYIRSESIRSILYSITKYCEELNEYDDSDDESDDGREVDTLLEQMGINVDYSDYQYDEDDETDIIGYKHKLSKSYSQSKILENSKNAKREYNRHGVLISINKKHRKHDEKIIREFLNEFIPGNSEWKREFRNDILKRWMRMYHVSKSDLKELEKVHNKAKKNKNNAKKLDKTLEFTSRIFNRPSDRWSDPNR